MSKGKFRQYWPWPTILFWSLVCLGFVLFIKTFSSILLPFVVSLILAYLLNPIIDKMAQYKIKRIWAVLLVLSLFLLAFAGLLIWIIPTLYMQVEHFLKDFSSITEGLMNKMQAALTYLNKKIPFLQLEMYEDIEGQIKQIVTQHSGSAWNMVQNIFLAIFDKGAQIIGLFSLIFLTPVITFYLLLDWDKLVNSIRKMIPLYYTDYAKEIFEEMEYVLAGFLRGQLLVCAVLGFWFSLSLSTIGLPYGVLIGMIIGLVAFIPYLGTWIGVLLGLGTAIAQFDNVFQIIAVAIALILGQLVESNYLSPKLVGDRVNLHPVWIIFALLAAATIAGFTGVLLAVPIAACIGVLVRFTIKRYRDSGFYLGFSQKK